MAALDEAIFAIPEILHFQAALIPANGASRLSITVHCAPCRVPHSLAEVREALTRVPAVREAVADGRLDSDPIRLSPENWLTTGAAKRALIDRRQETQRPWNPLPRQPIGSSTTSRNLS